MYSVFNYILLIIVEIAQSRVLFFFYNLVPIVAGKNIQNVHIVLEN